MNELYNSELCCKLEKSVSLYNERTHIVTSTNTSKQSFKYTTNHIIKFAITTMRPRRT